MTIDLNFFNKFFIDYQQRFVHFACTYVHDEAVAEDFVIESMMYYWENKDRLPADTNIPAYVLTTIKHKCIDHLRHQQIRQDVSDEISQIYAWELSGRIVTLDLMRSLRQRYRRLLIRLWIACPNKPGVFLG